MLWMAISYLMMLVSGFGLGFAFIRGMTRLTGFDHNRGLEAGRWNPIHYLLAGIVILTVYAQIVSLFTAVTYVYAFLASGVALLLLFVFRKSVWKEIKDIVQNIRWYEWILFLIFTIFVMFLTSLHPKQYDNYLYQAQMLRYYEEYGYIKGMANISTRLGFNNSIYALMALYSFKGIYGFSLHTVNSALCLFFGIFAIHGICSVKKTKAYVSAGLKALILAYVFYNAELLNCIGTDVSAGLFGFLIMILFAEAIEKQEKDSFAYGMLALYIVFTATIKVSMGMLGILVLYPAYRMLKGGEWKRMAVFISAGLFILLPWLVRNVLISGWLLYPLPALDLFDVKWKLPYETVVYEEALVKGWARIQTSKVFDTMEMAFREWFPMWFRALPLRYRLLLYLNGAACIYEILQTASALIQKKLQISGFMLLKLTAFAGIVYWLLSAPDIRFGWCYLTAFPAICIFSSGIWQKISKIRIHKWQISGVLFGCMVFVTCLYVFAKANCLEVLKTSVAGRINLQAFYIYQGDFSTLPVEEFQINGDTFYYSPVGDQVGYYGFPGTTDKALLENLGYLGESFEDGVYYKGGQSW